MMPALCEGLPDIPPSPPNNLKWRCSVEEKEEHRRPAEASPRGRCLRAPQDIPLEKSPWLNVFLASLQAQTSDSACTERVGQHLRV